MAGAAVSIAAIVVRLLWVPVGTYVPRDPLPPKSWIFILAWTGMRGIVSPAAALALPVATASSAPFPFRTEVILITFMVILSTLVLQGLSLSPLIARLRLQDDQEEEREESLARTESAQAALTRLDEAAGEVWTRQEHVDRLRELYAGRVRKVSELNLGSRRSFIDGTRYRRLRLQTIAAERKAVIALRDRGDISDDVLHLLEQELDVEALRLGAGEKREAG